MRSSSTPLTASSAANLAAETILDREQVLRRVPHGRSTGEAIIDEG
jgi:hypothetical protein